MGYLFSSILVHENEPTILALYSEPTICENTPYTVCIEFSGIPVDIIDPFLPIFELTLNGQTIPLSGAPSLGLNVNGNHTWCFELYNPSSNIYNLLPGVTNSFIITGISQTNCQTNTTVYGSFEIIPLFDWIATPVNCALSVYLENLGCYTSELNNSSICFDMGDGTGLNPLNCTGENYFGYNYSNPGTYTIDIYYQGDLIETLTVTVVGELSATEISSEYLTKCCINGAEYTVPNNYVSYTWTVIDGSITAGQGTNSITVDWDAQAPGSYVYVTVVDANGCEAIAEFFVDYCCKIEVSIPSNANVFETPYCGTTLLSSLLDSIFVFDTTFVGQFNGSISPISITTTDFIIINNELIDDIPVFTFLDCPNIYFGPNAKITINPSMRLTFESTSAANSTNGTKLRAKCNQPWDGIYVSNTPLNGSQITLRKAYAADAKNVIVSEDAGIYVVENSILENNETGVLVKRVTPNALIVQPGRIYGTLIQTNALVPNYFQSRGKYGVRIENCDEVFVGALAVTGFPIGAMIPYNTFKNLDFGVYATNSNVRVYRNNFIDIDNPSATNINNYFNNGIAVYSSNGGLFTPPSTNLIVGNNTIVGVNYFINCATGIFANRRVNTLIQQNTMTGMDIAGVVVRNSANMNHQIRNNNVSLNKGFIAIYLWNIPGSTAKVEFNNINNQGTPATKGTAGIAADAIGATFSTDLEINNNTVQHSDYGILVYTVPNAKIRNNTITRNITNVVAENYGQNIYGIQVVFSAGAIIENNLVNRMATNSFPTAANPNLNLIGIHAENSPEVQIFENTINRWGKGIQAKGINSNSDMYCNQLNKCFNAFFLDNADVGDQGALTPSVVDQDNRFGVGNNANVGQYKIDGTSIQRYWYYRNGAIWNLNPYQPLAPNSPIINSIQINGVSVCNNGPIGPGPKSLVRQRMFEEIVNDTKNFTNFDTTLRYLDNMYALMEFERDTTWLVTGDVSDTLYQSYYNTRIAGNLGRMCAISKSYANEDYATLSQENSAIVCNCPRESNIKQANSIFLNTWANDDYAFNVTDETFLQNLACSDALDNGPGVYSARVLLGFFAACDNGYIKSSVVTPQYETRLTNTIQFNVYPNPSDKEVFLNYTFTEELKDVQLMVYDITGKLISKQVLSNETDVVLINNQEIENGIYIYSIVAEGNLLGTGRFVIK